MEQRTLGSTDLRVSRTCLGTMTFGAQADQSAAASMLDLALERGVNFIDTANVYNGGAAEEVLGQLLRGRRDRVVLASKVGIKMGENEDQIGLSPATITRQIEETLRRLQTEYLDIYYLHQPDYSTPLDETLTTMGGLVADGKVRHLAASNYAAWQVVQMLWQAEAKGLPRIRITQPMYNLLARNVETEFLPMCQAYELGRVVYNPLAGGMLTGKHNADRPPAPGTRFDRNQGYQQRYWHAEMFAALQPLADAAARDERTLISLALGWLLHHAQVDVVILGASRLAQLQENFNAVEDGPLSAAALETCEKVWERLRGVSPKYNR